MLVIMKVFEVMVLIHIPTLSHGDGTQKTNRVLFSPKGGGVWNLPKSNNNNHHLNLGPTLTFDGEPVNTRMEMDSGSRSTSNLKLLWGASKYSSKTSNWR